MRDHDIEDAKQYTLEMEAEPVPKLSEIKAFLRKRSEKVAKTKEYLLYSSYEAVIADLERNTDSCTGELY